MHMDIAPVMPTGGYRLPAKIDGVDVRMLLDTGAAVTLLRHDIWLQIASRSPRSLKPWPMAVLVSAGGNPLTIHGCADIMLGVGGRNFKTEMVVVSPLTSEAILGLDFLQRQRALIDLDRPRLCLKESACNIPLQSPSLTTEDTIDRKVRCTNTVEIPSRSVLEITGSLETSKKGTWLIEEVAIKPPPVAVACALVQTPATIVPVRVLNVTLEPVTLYAGMVVATIQPVTAMDHAMGSVVGQGEVMGSVVGRGEAIGSVVGRGEVMGSVVGRGEATGRVVGRRETVVGVVGQGESEKCKDRRALEEEEKQEILQQLAGNCGPGITPCEKERFRELLTSYVDVLALTTDDLGRTNKLRHHIDTGDAPPIRQSVRRIPPYRREEVRDLLNKMLDRVVIEPSSSPWASPIVLVRKDGSTRFCIDYRKVNEVTRKDAYPLPRIDTTLDTLHGSQWFSTLDLISGYWQVEVEESDKEKTAFCTTEGLYQFRVMPFGLCNVPASFQRLMDLVLAGLQWSECLVYLDDVIVIGRNFEEHLQNIGSVLQRLRESGLQLKPSKCSFFKTEVEYLGHIISRDGVATDPKKTERVSTWPTPSTRREVQQFLGLAGYYRRFVKDFALIAQPLHRLTERTNTFVWTNECQESFDKLRDCLCSTPILAYPNFQKPFILDTDASDVGIGAVLSQLNEDGRERVIAYGSRLLTKPEHQYCVTRRELLAVVTFTRQYRCYLMGRKFVLRTDNGSLTWLRNFREPEGQLARWLELLQELDFDIVHRRGSSHTNADALSRVPCRQCGREGHALPLPVEVAATTLEPPRSHIGGKVREAQLADHAWPYIASQRSRV